MICPRCAGEGVVERDGILQGCIICNGTEQLMPAVVSQMYCIDYTMQVLGIGHHSHDPVQ